MLLNLQSFTFDPVEAIDEAFICETTRSLCLCCQQVIDQCVYLNLTLGAR